MENPKKKKKEYTNKYTTTFEKIEYLKCDICHNEVYEYKQCQNNWVYCSYDCLCVLFLNYINEHECTHSNFTDYFVDNQS